MLFSSVIAENANRRSRLSFPTPVHVPAPSNHESGHTPSEKAGTSLELERLPSWMENRDDPFGPDTFVPTLDVLHIKRDLCGDKDAKVEKDTISESTVVERDATIRTDENTNAESKEVNVESVQLDKKTEAKKDEDDPQNNNPGPENASQVSRNKSASLIAPSNPSTVSKIPPVIPIPAILIAGDNALPMLSALTHVSDGSIRALASRRPYPASVIGGPIASPMQRFEGHQEQVQVRGRNGFEMKRSESPGFVGLSNVEIPHTPFNPFGDLKESPFVHNDKGDVEEKKVLDNDPGDREARKLGDSECIVNHGQRKGSAPSLGLLPADNFKGEDSANSNDLLHPHQRLFRKLTKSLVNVRTTPNQYSLGDMPRRSLTKLDDEVVQGKVTTDPFAFDAPGLTNSSGTETGSDDTEDVRSRKIKVHVVNLAQHTHAEQAPSARSEHATPMHENVSANGVFPPTIETATTETAASNEKTRLHRSSNTSFPQAVMGKIRKLAHLKKGSAS